MTQEFKFGKGYFIGFIKLLLEIISKLIRKFQKGNGGKRSDRSQEMKTECKNRVIRSLMKTTPMDQQPSLRKALGRGEGHHPLWGWASVGLDCCLLGVPQLLKLFYFTERRHSPVGFGLVFTGKVLPTTQEGTETPLGTQKGAAPPVIKPVQLALA